MGLEAAPSCLTRACSSRITAWFDRNVVQSDDELKGFEQAAEAPRFATEARSVSGVSVGRREMARSGGCRCGLVRYDLTGDLGPVFNCHCRFCRQIHGAAFTTIAMVPRSNFQWSPGSSEASQFKTPGGSVRNFCGVCATPVCNLPREENLLCLVVASLDDDSELAPWAHFNIESKAPWFTIADDLPQFEAGPTPEEWAELAHNHAR